jgi:hypothetical protein
MIHDLPVWGLKHLNLLASKFHLVSSDNSLNPGLKFTFRHMNCPFPSTSFQGRMREEEKKLIKI